MNPGLTAACMAHVLKGEYLWNHTNGSMLTDFFVKEYIGGEQGMGSAYVDGMYIGTSVSREHSFITCLEPLDLNLAR